MRYRPPSRPSSAVDQKRQLRRAQQQRHREREREGRRAYLVEIGGAVLDMLVRNHWLGDDTAKHDPEVGRAVSRLLSDMAENDAAPENKS
jgi:hypothetical protein